MDKKGLIGKLIIVAIIIFFLVGTGIYFKNGSKGAKTVEGIGKIVEEMNVTDKILNITDISRESENNRTGNKSGEEEIDVSKINNRENNSNLNSAIGENITLNYTKLSD